MIMVPLLCYVARIASNVAFLILELLAVTGSSLRYRDNDGNNTATNAGTSGERVNRIVPIRNIFTLRYELHVFLLCFSFPSS